MEKDNVPGIFTTESCKAAEADMLGSKTKIRMKLSGIQSLCFGRYLGLMIRDLIPDGNKYWKLYLIFRKIIGIVRENRPLIHFWSIPTERKHTDLKAVAVNTNSYLLLLV